MLGCPIYAGMSDGPYRTENLQPKLIGRVVGVAFTALGGQLPSCAGWEDEETGNAAFDPAEYLDVLIRTGHEPAPRELLLPESTRPGAHKGRTNRGDRGALEVCQGIRRT